MMSANKNHAALCPRVTAATATIIDNITHEKRMDGIIFYPFVGPSRPTRSSASLSISGGSVSTVGNAKPAS
jgi:hypothetical protein